MTTEQFFEELDTRIAKYDLLCHPFYEAWSAGELTREDLREYAQDYYHHVEAFPSYLAELAVRLDESELRRAVLANMADEKGMADAVGRGIAAPCGTLAGLRRRHGSQRRHARTHTRIRNYPVDLILPRGGE